MATITMEHYRDFIGTLAHQMAEINTDMKAWEHAWERGEYDYCDYIEYDYMRKEFNALKECQDFFFERSERWMEFDTLESLKAYVQKIKDAYDALDAYSRAVFSYDTEDVTGVTDEEWDRLEWTRMDLSKSRFAWVTFEEFCEYGEVF